MRPVLAILLAISLAGCFAPVVEGGWQAADYSKRGSLEPKAAAGDAQAQYDLGNTYCCVVTGQSTTAASVMTTTRPLTGCANPRIRTTGRHN